MHISVCDSVSKRVMCFGDKTYLGLNMRGLKVMCLNMPEKAVCGPINQVPMNHHVYLHSFTLFLHIFKYLILGQSN
jgi:hypothetical protein